MRTTRVPSARARIYLEKSRRFAAAARAALDDGHWDPAASAAIHAAINAADAVCVRHLGLRAAASSHQGLIPVLQGISGQTKQQLDRFVRHVERLLGMKTLAEYRDELLTERDAKQAVAAMERALKIVEGWAAEWPRRAPKNPRGMGSQTGEAAASRRGS